MKNKEHNRKATNFKLPAASRFLEEPAGPRGFENKENNEKTMFRTTGPCGVYTGPCGVYIDPVVSTQAPMVWTQAPVVCTRAPVVCTQAPVVCTEAPVCGVYASPGVVGLRCVMPAVGIRRVQMDFLLK